MNKRSSNMNLNKFRNLKLQKVYLIDSLDRWNQDEILALVSSNLDERVKSYGYLKNQGQAVLQKKK